MRSSTRPLAAHSITTGNCTPRITSRIAPGIIGRRWRPKPALSCPDARCFRPHVQAFSSGTKCVTHRSKRARRVYGPEELTSHVKKDRTLQRAPPIALGARSGARVRSGAMKESKRRSISKIQVSASRGLSLIQQSQAGSTASALFPKLRRTLLRERTQDAILYSSKCKYHCETRGLRRPLRLARLLLRDLLDLLGGVIDATAQVAPLLRDARLFCRLGVRVREEVGGGTDEEEGREGEADEEETCVGGVRWVTSRS